MATTELEGSSSVARMVVSTVMAKYRITRGITYEIIEADGFRIEHGGVLTLHKLTGKPRNISEVLAQETTCVKAFAAHAWVSLTVEEE